MPGIAGFLDKHYFLFRRLHSLTGVFPVGVFLCTHLLTNSSIVWGMFNSRAKGEGIERGIATFQEDVTFINHMPLLLLIEISLWGAIAFHAALGVYYARTGKFNTTRYAYQDNWRYVLQRVTGYLALLFIFYHIATLRWGWSWLVPGATTWEHVRASSTLAAALRGSAEGSVEVGGIIVGILYAVGVTSSVFHFANGLWTAAITWGLTVSVAAQKRWGYICFGLGAGLMVMGWAALIGFMTLNPVKARAAEDKLHAPAAEAAPANPAGTPAGEPGTDGKN